MICVMLVAAEPSGDAIGAALAKALRRRLGGQVRFVGVGGPLMAAEGLVSGFDISGLAVMGVFDALRAWPLARRRARDVAQMAEIERPAIAVLIDSWGFTLRVAHQLRRAAPALPIVKYVAPQVWATRPGRARTLARSVDHLLTIHGFDAPLFERWGLDVTFVGNPVLAQDVSRADPARCRSLIGAAEEDRILLLAPGSRPGEIARLLGPFGEAAAILRRTRPDLRIVIASAPAVSEAISAQATDWLFPTHLARTDAERLDAMAAATAALACSGTVTTELARCGAPMIVAYRLGPVTALIVRALLRTRFITLFNVAAGRAVAPELIQGACTGPRLAAAAAPLLDDPAVRRSQVFAQRAAVALMQGEIADPADAAARAVLEVLGRQRASRGI